MDTILKQSLLYDFYGELLNEHQKTLYEQVILEDLSLREVADGEGITRQAVHDGVKRSSRSLEEYEKKLHLVQRFIRIKEQVKEISELLDTIQCDDRRTVEKIKRLSAEIIEEL